VGHSYGGVVITEAGNDPKVAGLVYIAAFAPDKGESVSALIKNPPPGAPVPPIMPPQDGYLFLDRARFPSDTLSTHFFRAPTFRALGQVGVYEEVQAKAPHLTINYNAVDGIVFPEAVDRPEDYPFYLCVRRITLDDILVRRARGTSNVDLREAAKATELLKEDGQVVGVAWVEPSGRGEAKARVVVGADGLHSFVAKEVGAIAEHEEPVHRAMYYAYYRGVEPTDGPAAEFHYRGNALVYCFPCDDDLTLLAASVPIARFGEFKHDPEGMLLEELRSMTALAPRLARAERAGEVRRLRLALRRCIASKTRERPCALCHVLPSRTAVHAAPLVVTDDAAEVRLELRIAGVVIVTGVEGGGFADEVPEPQVLFAPEHEPLVRVGEAVRQKPAKVLIHEGVDLIPRRVWLVWRP